MKQTWNADDLKSMVEFELDVSLYRDFVRNWDKVGTENNEQSIDKDYAMSIISMIYKNASLKVPDSVVIFDSPFEMFKSAGAYLGTSVKRSIADSLKDGIMLIDSEIPFSLKKKLKNYLFEQLHIVVWGKTGRPVLEDIQHDVIYSDVKADVVQAIRNDTFVVQQDIAILAYHDFCLRYLPLQTKKDDLFEPLIELSKLCWWWMPCRDICLIAPRPIDSEKMKTESGITLRYRWCDGYKIDLPLKSIHNGFLMEWIDKIDRDEKTKTICPMDPCIPEASKALLAKLIEMELTPICVYENDEYMREKIIMFEWAKPLLGLAIMSDRRFELQIPQEKDSDKKKTEMYADPQECLAVISDYLVSNEFEETYGS